MPGAVKASVGNDTGCIWLSAPTWKEYALQRNYQLVLGIARFKRAKKTYGFPPGGGAPFVTPLGGKTPGNLGSTPGCKTKAQL